MSHQIQDAAALYRAILASTLDPVITIDAHGVIQAASDSIERVFGWTPGELIGCNVNRLMPDPHHSRHDGYLAQYSVTGETGILGRTREFEGVRKDGTVFPIELSVSRVDVPGRAEPLFTGILRDITQRKQAERALQESEHRFRKMLENVEIVAVMLDTDGNVTFCNDYLLGLTHRAREEVIGRNWFELFVPPDQAGAVRAVFRQGIDEGRLTAQYENEIMTASGERRIVAWNNTVIRDPAGNVVGVTGLGVDVTEQKRADRELLRHREHLEELVAERTGELEASHEQLRTADRLASIGTLAAGLGHDMNNVLLPVRCRLDALEANGLPEPARKHLEEVRKSVGYLQQLADGLHLLSLDPDDAGATTEGTDLTTWWDQVGPLLARGLPKNVRLATSWPSDLPPVALAPHKLTQAVLNLVLNAGEAVGDDGKVRIWAQTLDGGAAIRLGVTDNGRGMTPDVKRRALDPFYTTKKRGLGTGLGLSLVQGVARSAGGSVHIDSAAGAGTTILLTLPAGRPGGDAGSSPPAPDIAAFVSVGDARLASYIRTVLDAAGFRTDAAEPGESRLWICDPSPQTITQAREYLSRPGRRIIVLGPATRQWRDLGAVVIDDPESFESLREHLLAATSYLNGAPLS